MSYKLKNYYKSLHRPVPPKTALIEELTSRTRKTRQTVRAWLLEGQIPEDEADIAILSELTKIPVDELFKKIE